MKKVRLFIPVIGLILFTATIAHAQSKKEQISFLSRKADSLQKVLAHTSDSLHHLEIKLARLEGAAEAHKEVINRLESRSDSLNKEVTDKSSAIENLTSQLAKLNESMQLKEKEWTAKNEELTAELTVFKQKGTPAPLDVKTQNLPEVVNKDTEKTVAAKQDDTKTATVEK